MTITTRASGMAILKKVTVKSVYGFRTWNSKMIELLAAIGQMNKMVHNTLSKEKY